MSPGWLSFPHPPIEETARLFLPGRFISCNNPPPTDRPLFACTGLGPGSLSGAPAFFVVASGLSHAAGEEERLEELLALIEHLHHTDQLRYFDDGDFRALEAAHDALDVEIRQHKEDV